MGVGTGQVRHENIVRVEEIVIGSTMDDIFIVMEFMQHDVKVSRLVVCARVRVFTAQGRCSRE